MDPMKMLDMKTKTGISESEVDAFSYKMDKIAEAMEQIKNGTFDPETCDVPGYKTDEQLEKEEAERQQKELERKQREIERKRQQKQEEHDTWWHKAKLRYAIDTNDDENENDRQNRIQENDPDEWANRIVAAYKKRDANDYSMWEQWEPQDPVTKEEKAQQEALLEKMRNEEFEQNNPEFCQQFKQDLEKRQETQRQKEQAAEKLKRQGNLYYKKKQYEPAIAAYMRALEKTPFNEALLTNIAQCYLRLQQDDDSVEFSTRALYVNPQHVKALSRRAAAWHRQQKWHEAAQEMKKAVEIDPDNEDLAEQHSVIVGDYEDSLTHKALTTQLAIKNAPVTSVEAIELKFLTELLAKMDEDDEKQKKKESEERSQSILNESWVAYELLVSFLRRTEEVRAFFRTSGAFQKLLERIVSCVSLITTTEEDDDDDKKTRIMTPFNAMLQCVAAALTNDPRNQVVSFHHTSFRTAVFALWTGDALVTPWLVRESALRILEEAVDTKSWKQAMIHNPAVLSECLKVLECNNEEPAQALGLAATSASSICFTISGTEPGLKALHGLETTLRSVSLALARLTQPREAVTNLLGFLTNLSTCEAFRVSLEKDPGLCRELINHLLTCCTLSSSSSDRELALFETTRVERALAVLLNLSFDPKSQVRTDLVGLEAVPQMMALLKRASASSVPRSSSLILVWSRATSLLCRLHVVSDAQTLLTDSKLLALLCDVASHVSTALMESKDKEREEEEGLWQLSAQLWCHLGWSCSITVATREKLRQLLSLDQMLQFLAFLSCSKSQFKKLTATQERVLGNLLKVLIAFQSMDDPEQQKQKQKQLKVLEQRQHLTVLVQALQELSDGQARKNVAILLAKLCTASDAIKETVRSLRGIEMMLSISRGMKKITSSSSSSSSSSARITQAPAY